MSNRTCPVLTLVLPCYNEQEVLPITAPQFLKKIMDLVAAGLVSDESRVLFVNDGSKDNTWQIIRDLAAADRHYTGIAHSRNRGRQNAVLAGLMEAMGHCDITISIDCGGQDDINAMADVVAVDVDESLLDEAGKLCLNRAKLIVYSHGDYLALGRKLGSFGYSVRKKGPRRK